MLSNTTYTIPSTTLTPGSGWTWNTNTTLIIEGEYWIWDISTNQWIKCSPSIQPPQPVPLSNPFGNYDHQTNLMATMQNIKNLLNAGVSPEFLKNFIDECIVERVIDG